MKSHAVYLTEDQITLLVTAASHYIVNLQDKVEIYPSIAPLGELYIRVLEQAQTELLKALP